MARKIVIFAIAATVIVVSILSLCNTYRVQTKVTDMLDRACLSLEQNNMEQTCSIVEDIRKYWEENEWLLIVYIDQTHIDEMADSISRIEAYAYNRDQNELYAELKLAEHVIEHIWKSHLPTINNIL